MFTNLRALVGAFAFSAALLGGASSALAQTTVTFNATGASQSFVVPAGVTSVEIISQGAQGFDTFNNLGGRGGRASGTLAVTPGETLTVFVGGRGTASTGTDVIMGGGFNGGGDGKNNNSSPTYVGGGGGASDVRQGGVALQNRKIVAGGGGGATANVGATGGDGGGLVGADGGDCCSATVGTGGTQVAGGTLRGGLGVGGSADGNSNPWVGGGGGGYYGGGVASAHGGAGGGSSYIGGSGLSNGLTTAGVRVGDGIVTITYAQATAVPTLSEWAMILFGVVLAGGAALMIRRRSLA